MFSNHYLNKEQNWAVFDVLLQLLTPYELGLNIIDTDNPQVCVCVCLCVCVCVCVCVTQNNTYTLEYVCNKFHYSFVFLLLPLGHLNHGHWLASSTIHCLENLGTTLGHRHAHFSHPHPLQLNQKNRN